MRFLIRTVAVTLLFLAPACSSTRHTATAPVADPLPYTRIARPDTNTVELQIAIRKLVPAHHRGPAILLAGASHIGEPSYYKNLQKQLDAQNLVLFEGVNADSHSRRVRSHKASPKGAIGDSASPGLQSTMASSLGLVFQLDAIDYDRANFLNSDLSIDQIQRLMLASEPSSRPGAQTAESSGSSSFQFLLKAMDGSSFLGSMLKLGIQFIGSDSKMRSITKLALIEALGQLQGDLSQTQGLPPDMQNLLKVLIEARNQAVVEDFKTESAKLPRNSSIAIFYGTGHMDNMERRFTHELDYRPAGDTWLTAFSVNLRQTGLTPSEVNYVHQLVKWQMGQLNQRSQNPDTKK